ncbi:hypothetical protein [Marinisporobacter balticus]|uniref:Uncharacterized protein n=1 Tax=Marinisporobacter balticus TaxID=2018667 RepID=A0A4R2KF47_9FIRM|nr:hypothetical protein [Marinisporobacter balticus]TCO72291.1 hypothetical protein EV214_11842 [Marinisporobacter balticus]
MKKKIIFKDTDDYFLKMNKEVGIFTDDVGKSLYYKVKKTFGEDYIVIKIV